MIHEEATLVVDRFGKWRVEPYAAPPRFDPRFEWASETVDKPYIPPRKEYAKRTKPTLRRRKVK